MSKKKPMALEPGKTYKGSGVINEFGEVTFRFYGKSDKGRDPFRKVTSRDNGECEYLIEHNTSTLRLRLSVPLHAHPCTRGELLQNLFINALIALGEYQI